MASKCPKCREVELYPLKVPGAERDRAPGFCKRCQGVWVPDPTSLVAVLDSVEIIAPGDREPGVEAHDRKTGFCPAGHRIMTRAKVYAEPPYYLERCGTCTGIWFDGGEIHKLKEHPEREQLLDFWSTSWQERKHEERSSKQERVRMVDELGEELVTRVEDLAGLVRDHPMRGKLLAYFTEHVTRR